MITLLEAQNRGLIEHLEFSIPTERLDTQYGASSVEVWMRNEQARIGAAPGRIAELVSHNGRLALFVNDIGTL